MNAADLQVAVLQALDQAGPDATVAVLRPLLARHLCASHVDLLLSNYQLTALHPMSGPDNGDVLQHTPAGEAFVSQRPVTRPTDDGETEVYLPVSVRGDRLGVLQLILVGEPSHQTLDQLAQLATVIGYAVQASARHSDVVERATRSERLTLAAELQWQLLPGRGCRAPEYRLAGHLEPAYHVHADNFDWSQDPDRLTLSVTDSGEGGASASLLTTLAVTALRNARRAGLGLADQACLADQAVYAHHQSKHHVNTLLVGIDLTTGRADAVRAGSPLLLILRDGHVLVPPLSDQLPLGMFEGTDYVAEHFSLITGDRLLLVSDGIHAAGSPTRELFGDARLPRLLEATADLPVGGVVRRVIEDMFAHRDLAELDDDAAVICLDWQGPGAGRSEELAPFESAPSFHCPLSLVADGDGGERALSQMPSDSGGEQRRPHRTESARPLRLCR